MKTRVIMSGLAAVILAITLAACGALNGAGGQPLSYAPADYGVTGHCYWAGSAAEAAALQDAGLCPRSWAPTPMPLAWHEEYWDYYDSSAYVDTYVPARARTVYVRTEATFGRVNRAAITTRSRQATYRSSSGTLVNGTAVTAKTRFGPGKSFGSTGKKYGGGSLRPGSPPAASSRPSSPKPGTSKSRASRSGSLRPGSARARSGGTRSGGTHSSGGHSSGGHR